MNKLKIPFLLLIVFSSLAGLNAEQNSPNIIVFLIDDMGFDDVGSSGNQIVETPTLDNLCSESAYFDQFTVAPACAPTRASFLTGRDYWRTGVTHVHGGGDYINPDEITIAEVLQKNGYRTGMWGKWHSGKSPGFFPWERGFEEGYYGELYKHENAHGWHNGEFIQTNKWSPELITDYAIDFIEKDHEKPFFAYLSFLEVHEPIEAPSSQIEYFTNKGLSPHLATLYAMMKSIDTQIERVLKAVQNAGKEENTIFVFFSDNGATRWNTNELGHWPDVDWNKRNQWNQLRGQKGQIWENGIHVPLYIKWKNEIDPRTIATPTNVTDLFPTLIELSGSRTPSSTKQLDGHSLAQIIRRGDDAYLDSRSYVGHSIDLRHKNGEPIHYHPVNPNTPEEYPFEMQTLYIKNSRFKLLLNPNGTSPEQGSQWYLFDWKNDPSETSNVASKHPELVEDLKKQLEHWYSELWKNPENFTRPVFNVGQNNSSISKVNAFGPTRLKQNASNSEHYLNQLKLPGDGAKWEIQVLQSDVYTVEITHMDESIPEGMKLQMSIGDETRNFTVNETQTIPVGEFLLKNGRHTVALEVVENNGDSSVSLDNLRHLIFHNTRFKKSEAPYPW